MMSREALREECQIRESSPIVLEMASAPDGRTVSPLPVQLKSLSARGVILAARPVDASSLDQVWEGRQAKLHLPADGTAGLSHIHTQVLWTRLSENGEGEVLVGLALEEPNLRTRQSLEAHLPQYPRDLKNLWDHWDQMQEERAAAATVAQASAPPVRPAPAAPRPPVESVLQQGQREGEANTTPASDMPIYLVGLGSVGAGVSLYFLGPDSYQMFGAILAVYGSLSIAGKSVWTMCRRTAAQVK
jgi:hypothetical protein